MTETHDRERSLRTGETLIRNSFSCLFVPAVTGIVGILLIVLPSEPIRQWLPPVDGLILVLYFLRILTMFATYPSALASCVGVILALLGLIVSQTRRKVALRCAVAVLLNVISIVVLFYLCVALGR